MTREYVEMRNNGYYIAGTRVSLDTVVSLYRDGASAEAIQDELPSLSLEQIHGAIAFYLGNRDSVDQNIADGERELSRSAPPLDQADPELYSRLQRARSELKR